MDDIITRYVWWQKTKKTKGTKPKITIIEERQTKEFKDSKAMTKFEEGKIKEGYETGHGYWLNIP